MRPFAETAKLVIGLICAGIVLFAVLVPTPDRDPPAAYIHALPAH